MANINKDTPANATETKYTLNSVRRHEQAKMVGRCMMGLKTGHCGAVTGWIRAAGGKIA